jgi:ethanolamine utilization protein EutA
VSSKEEAGGRVFFSGQSRRLGAEDRVELLSVGVDIGSSTSHMVFSRIVLELLDARYVVSSREAVYESEIMLTPYSDAETIDEKALSRFIVRQYANAGIDPTQIDTGALILTGVAVRRVNARAIGEVFAREAGKLVAVSAGDSLETIMSAYGSGAVARSIRDRCTVMNVDIGGGTSKIAICVDGQVLDRAVIEVGARLVCTDETGVIVRLEEAGHRFGAELGLNLSLGSRLAPDAARALASLMADRLFGAMTGSPDPAVTRLLRVGPLVRTGSPDEVTFSGGVAEFLYGNAQGGFGDLGALLAERIGARVAGWGPRFEAADQRIRATVIGASQYTVQLSGGTIFVWPLDVLPLRSMPVIAPHFDLEGKIDADDVASKIGEALSVMEFDLGEQPVAVFVRWRGSALFHRLDAFCKGVLKGLAPVLTNGRPIVMVGDGDVGGLIGIHMREVLRTSSPVVSIDGLELRTFDFIDIGKLVATSGAVPVVIKSLIFPTVLPSVASSRRFGPHPPRG